MEPPILVQRFMLNLRQSGKSEQTSSADSGSRVFSTSSIGFRVSSGLLGNIGEPLDHGQSEQFHEEDRLDSVSAGNGAPYSQTPGGECSNSSWGRSGQERESRDGDQLMILEVARGVSEPEVQFKSGVEVSSSPCFS